MTPWLTRKRLDVPEVAALLHAQARMLTWWADTEPESEERRKLWRDLHAAGDALAERAYGGPTVAARLSYWVRPYDARLDARVWRWRRPGPCRVVYAADDRTGQRCTDCGRALTDSHEERTSGLCLRCLNGPVPDRTGQR